MATITGQSGVVKLSLVGGSVAQVGEVRSFTIDGSADTIEDSVMGDTARTYKSGLENSTVALECYWDELDAQQLVLDNRAAISFEIYPTGTGSTHKYYTGVGLVTSKSITASFDGMVEASFGIQVNGALSEVTVP